VGWIVLRELPSRRIDANASQAWRRISLQRRAVVASDVNYDIASAQVSQSLEVRNLVGQMIHHRLVQARAIPVVLAIHLAGIVRMPKLQQAAVGAPDEFEWTRGDQLFRTAGEYAC